MRDRSFTADTKDQPFDEIILQQGELISDRLNMLRQEQYPPDAQKGLRQFSLAEVAYYLGVTQSTIKKLHLEGKGPEPETSSSGRRSYSAEQMLELRAYLDKHGRPGKRRYVPYRQPGEELHVVSVVNFKGGSWSRPPRPAPFPQRPARPVHRDAEPAPGYRPFPCHRPACGA